jgi:hypothetical protein
VIGRRLKLFDDRTDPKPDSTGGKNQKKIKNIQLENTIVPKKIILGA